MGSTQLVLSIRIQGLYDGIFREQLLWLQSSVWFSIESVSQEVEMAASCLRCGAIGLRAALRFLPMWPSRRVPGLSDLPATSFRPRLESGQRVSFRPSFLQRIVTLRDQIHFLDMNLYHFALRLYLDESRSVR